MLTHSREKKNIDKDWLTKRYIEDRAPVETIASEVPCSVPTIKKWLKKWGIRRGKFGQVAWNKGLTKETNASLARLAENRKGAGNPMYGLKPWNKGLTAEDNEILKAISLRMIGASPSKETREKMAAQKRGKFGEQANNWKGGKSFVNSSGYLENSKGYIHRIVAEKVLGRKLETCEHVHHFDKNKQNNTPKNLVVMSDSAHLMLHAQIRKLHRTPSPAYQQIWLAMNGLDYELVEVKDENKVD